LLNIYKIIGYVEQLKTERPECTQSNPNKNLVFAITILILFLLKERTEHVSTKFFMTSSLIPEAKFPLNNDTKLSKAQMLGERIFKFFINIFCVGMLFKIMLQEDCEFMDVRIGGNKSRALYYHNYPCQKIPAYLDSFYVFKLAYHLYELGYTLMKQRSRPDFPEYMLHHLMTWSLIFFSYSLNMLPIGAAVMILHDITDLAVTLFKLTIDIFSTPVCAIFYGTMIVSWMYFRLYFFPLHVIWRLQEECYDGMPCQNMQYGALNMLYAFLSGLVCLHIFWFYLMVNGFIRRLRSKGSLTSGIIMSGTANRST
jgi:TLC domain